MDAVHREAADDRCERIRVRGLVQGVGFRPTVWRIAQRHAVTGSVANDGGGVSIEVCGSRAAIDAFVGAIVTEAPLLARIDGIEREVSAFVPSTVGFVIAASASGGADTGVVADAATCAECLREVRDPSARRYRHPFANCTHCGPRLSIVLAIPYDRAHTTMRSFAMCADCAREYRDPADRRFHAQPIACPACGPRLWLEGAGGERLVTAAPGAGATPRPSCSHAATSWRSRALAAFSSPATRATTTR